MSYLKHILTETNEVRRRMANVYITLVECRWRQIHNCSDKQFEASARELPDAKLETDAFHAALENVINLCRPSSGLNGEASQAN
jgi:hypothetical protein